MYTPIVIDNWTGLNLADDPAEVGLSAAIELSNVDLDSNGRLRPRDGYVQVSGISAATIAPGPMSYFKNTAGAEFIVAQTNTATTTPISIDGGANGSSTGVIPVSNNSMLRFSGSASTHPRLYLVVGTSTMKRLQGTTWSDVALTGGLTGTCLATTPWDNRLVVCGSNHVVWFSNPDDPETLGVDNFVILHFGDGEQIRAAVTWQDQLFIFKETKFYVFYGTSVDTTGGAVFNYRTVNTGLGTPFDGGAVAGDEGVFFHTGDGVYLTTGGPAVSVSRVLGDLSNIGNTCESLLYHNRRLYVLSQAGSVLVYDPATGNWLYWAINVSAFCEVPRLSPRGGMYVGPTGSKKLSKMGERGSQTGSFTDDGTTSTNGTAVDWVYESGKDMLGAPDRKVIREASLWGNGVVTLRLVADATTDIGTVLNPVQGEAVQRVAQRATYFAYRFEGSHTGGTSDGPNYFQSLVFRVRDQEDPK